jgi:hypothetical protein
LKQVAVERPTEPETKRAKRGAITRRVRPDGRYSVIEPARTPRDDDA